MIGSSSTSGLCTLNQYVAGPGSIADPCAVRISIPLVTCTGPSIRLGAGTECSGDANAIGSGRELGASGGARRTRSATQRATSVPSCITDVPIRRTRLPGRRVVLCTTSRANGTGRSNSMVNLTVTMSGSRSKRSTSRPMRAATGPPCALPGSQGPRDNAVATKPSPSVKKNAEGMVSDTLKMLPR